MKGLLKKFFEVLTYFISFFYSLRTSRTLAFGLEKLYTLWLSNEFKHVGKYCHFRFPLYLNGGKYISLGDSFSCDQRLRLDAWDEFHGDIFSPEILIGDNVIIQKDCHIGAIDRVVIGNNVLLASKVYISDHSHGEITKEALSLPPSRRKLFSKGPVVIEDNVWLGEGVVVLPNLVIGENSIVGANSVVTKSLPKNSVVAGNPARVIRILE